MTKKTLLLCILVLWPMSSGPAAEPTWSDKRVTLEFNKTPLKEVLDTLEKKAGVGYTIAGDLLDSGITITAKMKDLPIMEAVEAIMKAASLSYSLSEHAVLSVYPKEQEEEKEGKGPEAGWQALKRFMDLLEDMMKEEEQDEEEQEDSRRPADLRHCLLRAHTPLPHGAWGTL